MGKKNKKSWILTLIIVFILIMSIGGGFFLISYVNRVSIDTNHIYMIGSVRGNIQRLVKLELSGNENQSIISEIDQKMDYIEENKDFIYNNDKTRLEYVDRMLRE